MLKNKERKAIRELLMRFVYQMSVTDDWQVDDWQMFITHQEDIHLDADKMSEDDIAYIDSMLDHIVRDLEQVDNAIKSASNNWKMERISKVELSIIRLATAEILSADDIPYAVSINEAVELSKKYGGEKSYVFVNGILGNISRAQAGADSGMRSESDGIATDIQPDDTGEMRSDNAATAWSGDIDGVQS